MFFPVRSRFWLLALMAAAAVTYAFASPKDNHLLRLVPPGAEIVAGIEDPQNENSSGRLLLITHNNNLDLADCVALTGVDIHREISEWIIVAGSSPKAELNEHLLLAAGQFDRGRIFRAAIQNGAAANDYSGMAVLVVKPFAREQREMLDTRWMAIPDDKTIIFGTPELVQKALDRYTSHAVPDGILANRVAQLHPDVNSWNVLAMSAPMLARHVAPGQLHAPWTHILDHADELTMGIHYGPAARLDFAVHALDDNEASSIANLLSRPQLELASWGENANLRIQNVSANKDRVQGSITVPGKKFDAWLASIVQKRSVNR